MDRSYLYAFPVMELQPGKTGVLEVNVEGRYQPRKLMFTGSMEAVRGHFRIKRTRRGLLDRESTWGATRIYRQRRGKRIWFRPGRTTLEFANGTVRSYLPSSVDYLPVDPLEYVRVLQVWSGKRPQLVPGAEVLATIFSGANNYPYNDFMDVTDSTISLLLKNTEDVPVKVRVVILGTSL